MRASLMMELAGLGLGVGVSQAAVAGGWDDNYCCGGTVYVHAPGPHHINVVHHPYAYGCCGPVYLAPRDWYWGGGSW
jgi:hypothetical protein